MSLYSPMQTKPAFKSTFISTAEQEQYQASKNAKCKNQRVQEIRKQENDLSKRAVTQKQAQLKLQSEQDEVKRKYQEYLDKLAQIEQLNRVKEQSLLEIGRAQREAEQFKIREQEQLIERQERNAYFQAQADRRYVEAQEWKKQQLQETEYAKSIALANQRKEASILEKQREQSQLQQFKEFSKTRIVENKSQEIENYEKFDRNAPRKQILRPEDFANTCFHNPHVVKHDTELEKENANDRANTTVIVNQTMLLDKAKQQRDMERNQKERGRRAQSIEQQKKVLEKLEHESRYLKTQEAIQIQKTPQYARQNNTSKAKQQQLSKAFDSMFVEKASKSFVEVRNHKSGSLSPKKGRSNSQSKGMPKSVKILTKHMLDTNLSNNSQANTSQRQDSLMSPQGLEAMSKNNNTSSKKKVKFEDTIKIEDQQPQSSPQPQSYLQSTKQAIIYNGPIQNKQQQPEQPEVGSEAEVDEEENDEALQSYMQQSITSSVEPTSGMEQSDIHQQDNSQEIIQQGPKTNQMHDIKAYIQQQEQYLERLEQERINTRLRMKKEEDALMNTFKQTRQSRGNTIPEESDEESSCRQSNLLSQSRMGEISPDRQMHQQNSQSDYNDSPNRADLQTIEQESDRIDAQAIMQQFLKPKKQQQPTQSKQNTIQTLQSPMSDLNYSLSDVKRDQISPISQNPNSLLASANLNTISNNNRSDYKQPTEVQQDYEETLGEIFLKRKAQLAQKLEQRQEQKQDDKVAPSKQDLVRIRKEMMKSNRQKQQEQQQPEVSSPIQPIEEPVEDRQSQLMKRLATGEKVKVEKKEMLAMNNKNYGLLPEVKRKQEELEKNESIKQRKQKVKEMDQKLRESMKQRKQ